MQVHATPNFVEAHHLRAALEAAHIPCTLRNDRLFPLAGEVPFTECWIEIWIKRPDDYSAAQALIAEILRDGSKKGPEVSCTQCGERHEPQFARCWRCGSILP